MQSQNMTNFPLNSFTSATNSTSSYPQLGSPPPTQVTPPSNNRQVGNWLAALSNLNESYHACFSCIC